ncbi:DNA glycosylase AlkZ-like family protein [Vallicoccus soli]|uniref:Winged helix DNA-binding domain-containing protein n=1 Tax=Vallicoccus soli TaxID=2339232 RepID=A0A3A3YR00_9ACTN|nr:crosslink repair DNA glycosylase YcaQ family protein [Vallicoccus soli]RJK93796.1 winged helix DNA-binding domain-containing protein [Vallicoccus soli]
MDVPRGQVLAFRVRAQELDREEGSADDAAVLDLGVQDTGPDGAAWALALRGVRRARTAGGHLALVWSVRGAPHAYRRQDLPGVAAAVAPFGEADAAKRVYDASKPLKAAGIPVLDALDAVAGAMRAAVPAPRVKGEVSRAVSDALPAPYVRHCRPCGAVHLFEQPFRLAALRAGLELEPGTSPPVLRPVPGFAPADDVPAHLDVVRGCLRFLGPATPQLVAGYLDAPVADVRARWPQDALEVRVDGERRWVLAADADRLAAGPVRGTRLLGPYDLLLQARDRSLLVPDRARAKALWPVLGRPGAVLHDGELAGLWRPRAAGRRLRVQLDLWDPAALDGAQGQAERLAAHRGVELQGVEVGA